MRVREGITNDYHIQENSPDKIFRMENEADKMSFLDMFRSKDYESYLYKENVKLEDQIKALKKENKEVWNQLHATTRWNPFPYSEEEVLNTILSEERKKNELLECSLNHAHEENRELKKKLSENRMLRTLEQYQKDEREQIAKIQTLEYELRGMKDDHLELLKEKEELKTELKIYKDFVTGIMGILNEEKEGLRK